jgi:LCP family protein required for cell wall assembly
VVIPADTDADQPEGGEVEPGDALEDDRPAVVEEDIPARRRWWQWRPWHRRGHHARKPSLKRRVLKIVAIIAVVLTVLAGAAVGAAYAYSRHLYNNIHKIALPPTLTRHRPIPLAGGSGPAGGPEPPVNILVVGSDSRAGLSKTDTSHYGSAADVAGQRSDTIMIMRIEATGAIQGLSIPRDLFVRIPGTNRQDRINTTFNTGPALLIQTIQTDLGIPIDYYVEVDFEGFRKIVYALGGVQICFPGPERDSFSGLNITKAGCQVLDPNTALAYVRARHMEIQQHGVWVYDPTSDFGRMARQQDFIKQVAARAQSEGLGNPLRLPSILRAIPDAVAIDTKLSFNELTRLARRFHQDSNVNINAVTLPVTDLHGIYSGGIEAALLQLQEPQAQTVLDVFREKIEQLPPRPASADGRKAAPY